MIHRKFLALAGAAAIAVASAAAADAAVLTYTFDAGSTFDFGDGNIYSATGSFGFDSSTLMVTSVNYTAIQLGNGPAGPFVFTGATSGSPTEVTFNNDGEGDEDTFFFGGSLAMGGTISIIGGAYNGSPVSASGSVTAGAVPEPASWAMMLGGFGLVGGAMRSRRKVAVSFG